MRSRLPRMERALFEVDPERPRAPSRGDAALVALFALTATTEGVLRPGLVHRPLLIATTLVVVFALAFRRARPLPAIAASYGVTIAAGLVSLAWGVELCGLYTHACLLLFPYTLLRWGSGRDVAIGLAFVAGVYAVSAWQGEMKTIEDVIGSAVVLAFPAAIGAAVRFRADAERRAVEHARDRERERLARELHDTVAHHVSAIAIQAQGGRAVLATRPEAAASALAAIEEEATRALSELRAMVTSLRDEAELAPRAGLADLERLARHEHPKVAIERVGALGDVAPTVQAALYRVAQEAVTNALRHARRATAIEVRVAKEGESVRLTVRDDGEPASDRGRGFGLVGMAERAALLGGTFHAGPHEGGGWKVDALLPRGAR